MKNIEKKRYLFFVIEHFYPEGGIEDVEFSFDTKEEMLNEIKTRGIKEGDCIYYQVFDTITFKFAESYNPENIFENLKL